jgi:hypothetical protein
MIGNDDVGLEEGAAVVSLEVNSEVSWDTNTNPLTNEYTICKLLQKSIFVLLEK